MNSVASQDGPPSVSKAEMIRTLIRSAHQKAYDIAPVPLSSHAVRHIATIGLTQPDQLLSAQIRKLCASVLAHDAAQRA